MIFCSLKNPYISILRNTIYTYQRFIFIIILLCCRVVVYAQQTESYSFQYYNTNHGLPTPEINCLAKDNLGFLWMGTSSGLTRYDGYNFENYTYSKEKELIGGVNVIKADNDNRLWIGAGAGLFCYSNNELIKISAFTELSQGVNDILLAGGSIWLATENGPVNFSIGKVDFTGKKKLVLADYLLGQWKNKAETIDKTQCIFISKATDGTVYIAQDFNLFRLLNNHLELIHTSVTGTDSRNKINAIFPVSKSCIYFDAASLELCRYENGVTHAIGFRNFYTPGMHSNLPGSWYVGTRGAFYFHPETGTASQLIRFSNSYIIWPTAVLQDNGFLWVASHEGLVKVKPSIFTVFNIGKTAAYTDFYSIAALQNGKVLLGANRGNVFEKKADSLILFKNQLVPSAEIKNLYEDERGWLWAATGYQGLVLIRNGRMERYTIENGLQDNSLYQFFKTSGGKCYVMGDQGMSEIIINADETISFKKFHYKPNTSKNATFYSGITAPDGTVWVGGEEGLAYLRNDSLYKFLLNGKQLSVNFMITDQENKIWIATAGEGILQCVFNNNNELEIVKQFTQNDGLNSTHYLALLADKDNNIWAGSSRGISVIGRKGNYNYRILNFDESDGFIKAGYSYIRLLQTADTTIWVATVFGCTSFKPHQLLMTEISPLVYITGIQQIERNKVIADKTSIPQSSVISEFGFEENSFNFTFTAIDYANLENIRYYYKLEGLDSNWTNAGNLRSISFENLSPGTYSFRVKARNSKSTWSKKDAVYTFIIAPPFWKTWWFVFLIIGTIILLSVLLIRKRISYVKSREVEKTTLQKLRATSYREQLEIEQIINYFATSISSVNSIDDILWLVARNCISKLNFEDCVIYLLDEERNVLVQKAAWGPKTTEENKILNPIELSPGKGIVGTVAATGKAVLISNTALDERYIVDDIRRMSEIAVPIVNDGKVIGVIDSEHSQKGFYTERHLQILNTIASLCAGKIETNKAEQQIREKEIEVLRLNKDFATSQLTALRMQMNPHFIFNALNSVQHFILQGNVIEANKYLSKFSKLQREILHCSSLQFISLEKELEILTAYLELEQFRFGESFTYQINMTEEIEPEEIKIPPMMLQPFVENAIWHGLMPRQTSRNLSIYFDLHTEDILLATIRDNGIGRAASARLKQNDGVVKTGYESKGMSMVQQRLQLLQQQYDKPFDAAISDITDIHGVVQGTQVTLKIFIGNKMI